VCGVCVFQWEKREEYARLRELVFHSKTPFHGVVFATREAAIAAVEASEVRRRGGKKRGGPRSKLNRRKTRLRKRREAVCVHPEEAAHTRAIHCAALACRSCEALLTPCLCSSLASRKSNRSSSRIGS